MLTTRWGTLVLATGWLGSWGLVFVHGAFSVLATVVTLAAAMTMFVTRDRAYVDPFSIDPLTWTKTALIWFPVISVDTRHNTRARLLRRAESLNDKQRECRELIDSFATSEAHNESLRVPVLQAEHDAAEREEQRLYDDIRRLEVRWESEDRERRYNELTGG
jgi:predicted nuclease with TOPRIM domain